MGRFSPGAVMICHVYKQIEVTGDSLKISGTVLVLVDSIEINALKVFERFSEAILINSFGICSGVLLSSHLEKRLQTCP